MLFQSKKIISITLGLCLIFSQSLSFGKDSDQECEKCTKVAQGIDLAKAIVIIRGVNEYYYTNQQWPKSNKEAGVAEPHIFSGEAVNSVEILPNGLVKISFNQEVDPDGYIILQGEASASDGPPKWHCSETNLDLKVLPEKCRNEIKTTK